ncbi:hypothetical protein GCM10011499_07410 [Pelagibacterium lentulum]|uniref:Uncharacterized protein n=1 Tax=Pelagibacterium lentulum TaxID=2029865 RepID=A0A916R7S6_9HYPH|nr:hypothetical protein GCM10011499_07410 [Pelagibacterium lentulum]
MTFRWPSALGIGAPKTAVVTLLMQRPVKRAANPDGCQFGFLSSDKSRLIYIASGCKHTGANLSPRVDKVTRQLCPKLLNAMSVGEDRFGSAGRQAFGTGPQADHGA